MRWILCALYFVGVLLLFYPTTLSLIDIWSRSDTFAHGFLIVPISLWLIWQKRALLDWERSPAVFLPVVLLVPIGLVWFLANTVDVLVIQQLALVAMLVVGLWGILGHGVAWSLCFPLAFLFFAVPMGEGLIPFLMEITADSTVWLIQQTGIPVYRDGMFFSLPTGHWAVEKACSGVRYLIASVTLGVLYAYLTYSSWWRRSLFVLIAFLVPVLANTARAFIIVMLGHFSDMTVATGVDHLIYGWFFFGLVMLLMFWLGGFFREDTTAQDQGVAASIKATASVGRTWYRGMYVGLVGLLLLGVWPGLATVMNASLASGGQPMEPPQAQTPWSRISQDPWYWELHNSPHEQLAAIYGNGGQRVGVYLLSKGDQETRQELVKSSSRLFRETGLQLVSSRSALLSIGGRSADVSYARLRSEQGILSAWTWYRIAGRYTANDYLAKLYQAMAKLGLGDASSARVIVVVPESSVRESPRQLAQDFLSTHWEEIEQVLNESSGTAQ